MATATGTVRHKMTVASSPAQVYRAFTKGLALEEWLCDTARVEARPGGRLYLAWNNGFYGTGEYQRLDPGRRVSFSWRGKGDPERSRVQVLIKPQVDSTLVTLDHSGYGKGKKWPHRLQELEHDWTVAFENLKTMLETGQDLRFVRRPTLGINAADDVNPELAGRLNLAVTQGVIVYGVAEGMGAQAAGFQSNDVLVRVGNKKVRDWQSLLNSLQRLRAGDEVKVTFYRGPEKKTTRMTLSQRNLPDVPATPQGLADVLRRLYSQFESDLAALFMGVTEEEADFRSGPDEWSAKETLAHLIEGERRSHLSLEAGIEDFQLGFRFDEDFPNVTVGYRALVSAYPTIADLLLELKRAESQTAALVEQLPASHIERRANYWWAGTLLLQRERGRHVNEHLAQMRASIEAARSLATAQPESRTIP